MAHDVFVSYSHKDKPVADAVVAGLESQEIRCWIAPRDVTPGATWGDAIVSAIEGSKVMVVVLSGNSNQSRQVVREVERAVAKGVIIIPFRIENIDPTGAMALFLYAEHWLDALTPPLERHIEKLENTIQLFLSAGDKAVLEEHLSRPATRPAARAPRRWPLPVLAVLLAIVIVAAAGAAVILRLLSEAPLAASATPIAAAVPADTVTPPTSTPTPTLTPTSTPTLTPTPPPSFRLLGSWPTSREARRVFVDGDTAYIANGEDGLIILDVSDPSQPEKIGSYAFANAHNVVVADHIAYLIEQGQVSGGRALSDRLVFLDVKIPSVPRLLGEYTPEGVYAHRSLDNLAVVGDTIYLALGDRLLTVDVEDHSEPLAMGEISYFSNVSNPGVAVADGIAYVQANRLHVVDVRDPAEPVEIGGFDPGWGSSVVVVDQMAYIAGWDTGLTILDVSMPAQPIKLGQYNELVGNFEQLPRGGSIRQIVLDVSVSGDVAYLTYHFGVDYGTGMLILESGVIAVDISDPGAPEKIAVYSELDEASSVFAADNMVFVIDRTRGLSILSRPE